MERKLIIGYDPESRRHDVLALGRLFAEVLAATPVVATVSDWPAKLLGADDLASAIELGTREPFAVAREELDGLDPSFRTLARTSPAAALNDLAEEEGALLMVLGSARHGPLGRTVLGSVGASLLHGAPCAIAVAPAEYAQHPEHNLLRIAVAFDGSAESWSALETATGLAERTHASLTVVTVAEPPRYGYESALAVLTEAELRDFEREEKQRLLELALGRLPAGLEHKGLLLAGEPGSVLEQASGDFDLLVAGSRGYGPLRRTLLGSSTRKLLHGAACPVLVLPRGVGIDPLGTRSSSAGAGAAPAPDPA